MKKVALIYKWIIISVLLQACILSYVNFVYLPNRGAIKATAYQYENDSVKKMNVRLPSDAKNVKVSYNGLFAAYIDGGNLVITDIQKQKPVKTMEPADGEFTFFRWLPDRDMLIYSTKTTSKGKGVVGISTYEVDTALDRSYPQIKSLPEGSGTLDIELSPLTNLVYVLIKTGDSYTRIYKYNIMDNLSMVMKAGADFRMKETAYTDTLFYQDGDAKVKKRDGKTGKTSTVIQDANARLLAVDFEDRAYIGKLDGSGKVTEIVFGKADQDADQWEKLELKSPELPEDISITPGGAVYTAGGTAPAIAKPDGSSVCSFKGKLLEVLDDYVVSQEGNKLELTPIEK